MSYRDKYGIDSHKMLYHMDRVQPWRDAGDDWERLKGIAPIYVEVSPTGRCTHRCTFCAVDYRGYQPDSRLHLSLFTTRVQEAAELGVRAIMFAGEGEPFLHPHFLEMVQATSEAGIDVAITTNGGRLHPEAVRYATWIKVSMDAGTRETHQRVHRIIREKRKRPEWDRVLDNVRDAVAYRNDGGFRCTIGLQCVLVPDNVDELGEMAKLASALGCDYVAVKPYSQHKSSLTNRYERVDYQALWFQACRALADYPQLRVRHVAFNRALHGRPYRRCHAVPFYWAYWSDNNTVWACSSYLGDQRFYLGDLTRETWPALWAGDRRRRVWEHLKRPDAIAECRENCRMDSVNEFLWDLRDTPEHRNFI